MKPRNNLLFSRIINQSLIVYKFKGYNQAKDMMVEAGLPTNVIDRVLNQSPNVRTTDWCRIKI